MADEVVRLKAEVRELQEALAAERAKPVQVQTREKRVEVPDPVRTREVVKPDPAVVEERDRLLQLVRTLRKQITENAKRERELVQYLEGMKRGRNDK